MSDNEKLIKQFQQMKVALDTVFAAMIPSMLRIGKALEDLYAVMEQEAAKRGMTVEEWLEVLRLSAQDETIRQKARELANGEFGMTGWFMTDLSDDDIDALRKQET